MAQQALRDLQDVVKGPNRPVIYTPPEMIPQWQPAFADKLTQAVSAALQAGVAAEKVFTLLDGAAAVDLDSLPDNLLAMCVESGLCPDTDLGGESLLHFLLNTQFPVPLGTQTDSSSSDTISSSNKAASSNNNKPTAFQLDQQAQTVLRHLQDLQHSIPAQHHPACGSTTLAELLRRGATPNLTDSSGNTALHMVVACMVSKKHFPDPSVVDQRRALQQQQQQSEDEDGPAQPQSNGSTDGTQTPAGPKQLDDNDKARAAYGSAAFIALLQAGWDPAVRNANGYTVSDLMLEGLSRYQTELSDLQDPEGVAQTTVALLSQKAPEKGLQQFLDTKIEGVKAVVDALLLMHRLAATAEAPRKQRSALSLVVVWLLLLAACIWWMYRKQR